MWYVRIKKTTRYSHYAHSGVYLPPRMVVSIEAYTINQLPPLFIADLIEADIKNGVCSTVYGGGEINDIKYDIDYAQEITEVEAETITRRTQEIERLREVEHQRQRDERDLIRYNQKLIQAQFDEQDRHNKWYRRANRWLTSKFGTWDKEVQ